MDWGSLLGNVAAATISSAGQYQTNLQNLANQLSINRENIGAQLAINADNIAAAAMNNQTAVDLANTAHQREVKDLRSAGLNPILSTSGKGSDVPTLTSPNLKAALQEATRIENPLSSIGSSAKEIGYAISRAADDDHAVKDIQVKDLGATVQTRGLLNEDLKGEIAKNRAEYKRDTEEALADAELARIKREEIESFMHPGLIRVHQHDDPSRVHPSISMDSKFAEQVREETRNAILSDLKMRSNANAREWIKSAKDISNAIEAGSGAFGKGVKGARLIKH